MNKLKSELFKKFELEESESLSVLGGIHTSNSTDISMHGGTTYDTTHETCVNGHGQTDVVNTGPSNDNKDKPLPEITA